MGVTSKRVPGADRAPGPVEEIREGLGRRIRDARGGFESRVAGIRSDVADVLELGFAKPAATAREGSWRERVERARTGLLAASGIAVLYNWVGILAFTGYVKLVFGFEFISRHPVLIGSMAITGIVVGNLVGLAYSRPMIDFFRRAREATSEAEMRETVDDRLRRRVLNAAPIQSLLDFAVWAVIGGILTGCVLYLEPDSPSKVLLHVFMGSLFAGELVSVFVFYQMEDILGRRVLPLILADRKASSVEGVWRVPTYVRIGLLFLTTSVVPLVYLLLLNRIDPPSTRVLTFAIVGSLVLGLLQVRWILASISQPIGRLANLFARMQRGEEIVESVGIHRTDALGRFAEMFEDLLRTSRERDEIRATFGRYVNPRIVEHILSKGVNLEGTRAEATILFVDIRGFTTIASQEPPERVVRFLDDYLAALVDIVVREEGIPNKFLGDGMLAVWGVPVAVDEAPVRAVRAARQMLDHVARLNRRGSVPGGRRIDVGIAIHRGEVVAGNVGSTKKMEFGVIGDAVNTCARIENSNRGYGTVLTVSRELHECLPPELAKLFDGPESIEVRGKDGRQEVFRHHPRED